MYILKFSEFLYAENIILIKKKTAGSVYKLMHVVVYIFHKYFPQSTIAVVFLENKYPIKLWK